MLLNSPGRTVGGLGRTFRLVLWENKVGYVSVDNYDNGWNVGKVKFMCFYDPDLVFHASHHIEVLQMFEERDKNVLQKMSGFVLETTIPNVQV